MVLWDEIAAEVAREYADVQVDKMLVDAMTVRMVMEPRSLDVVVATNLHADILSDLAAALAGSIGIAPTANLDPSRRHPSMFEPIHGSAFDITGNGCAARTSSSARRRTAFWRWRSSCSRSARSKTSPHRCATSTTRARWAASATEPGV
jgi:isocitrate dehydrogenase